jgi:hypothetical protein
MFRLRARRAVVALLGATAPVAGVRLAACLLGSSIVTDGRLGD